MIWLHQLTLTHVLPLTSFGEVRPQTHTLREAFAASMWAMGLVFRRSHPPEA
jgi:hypothetical protein